MPPQKVYQMERYDCSYSPEPECHPEAQGIHCAQACAMPYEQ